MDNPTPSHYILVIEDVPQILELLEVTLRYKGYDVITALDGKEALEIIEKQKPDLIITDILMPKLDGFMLAYRLRSHPETQSIPIIFLSATYVTREDKEFALNLGAVSFLEKPVDTDEFLNNVAKVLNESHTSVSTPLDEEAFYEGYRLRLEAKLENKLKQIERTKQTLVDVPEEQKRSFEDFLNGIYAQVEEIQRELDVVYNRYGDVMG